MDRKLGGIGIGVFLVLGLLTAIGFSFANVAEQETNQPEETQMEDKPGFTDADGDGKCDYAEECPRHQDNEGNIAGGHHEGMGGCHGSEGCPRENRPSDCPRMAGN